MMSKILTFVLFISLSLKADIIKNELGNCVVKVENNTVVLSLDVKKPCSLSFSDKKYISFSKGKHIINFSKIKKGIGIKSNDAHLLYLNGVITEVSIKNNKLSFILSEKKRVWISIANYTAGTPKEIEKVRESANKFLDKQKKRWGQIESIIYQNNFKRYVVRYKSFYNQHLKVNYIRALFINEFDWRIDEVPSF